MSDYEKLKDLLKDFGIIGNSDTEGEVYIEVGSLNNRCKVCGYGGFYVNFIFDDEGKFNKMVIAE
jgi:hypothetical protein